MIILHLLHHQPCPFLNSRIPFFSLSPHHLLPITLRSFIFIIYYFSTIINSIAITTPHFPLLSSLFQTNVCKPAPFLHLNLILIFFDTCVFDSSCFSIVYRRPILLQNEIFDSKQTTCMKAVRHHNCKLTQRWSRGFVSSIYHHSRKVWSHSLPKTLMLHKCTQWGSVVNLVICIRHLNLAVMLYIV